MIKFVTLAALLLITAPALAQPYDRGTPKIPIDTDYAIARRYLLNQGYHPERRPDADTCLENDSRCAKRPEMYRCAGTGLAQCLFTWRSPRGASIEITTIGEGNPGVAIIRCTSGCH